MLNVSVFLPTKEELYMNNTNMIMINQDFSWTPMNVTSTIINNVTVFSVNILVLLWLKIKEKTLVDLMVVLDCVANILVIGVMVLCFPVRVWDNGHLCMLISFLRSFVLVLNRLIPLTVLVYRVLMVCHVEFCYKQGEKVIRDKLFWFCLFCPVLNGIFTLIYHNHVRDFLICSGREEFLRFDLEDFWNTEVDRIESQEWMINLSWYHPLRLFTVSVFFGHFFMVPAGYLRILLFLKKQNRHILAISSSQDPEFRRRRQKNIISIGFNLFAWSLDVLGDILGVIFYRKCFLLAMNIILGVSCGLTPIVYIVGASQFRNKKF